MLARRRTLSALALLAGLVTSGCGDKNGPSGLNLAERVALAQKFQDKADVYSAMGAFGASFTLENAALSILVGARTSTFSVTSNGLVSRSVAGGAPVAAVTAGSYQGLGMRIRVISSDIDETSDFLIGWRGGNNPTDLVFGEDFGGEDGGGVFISPSAEWTATSVTASFSNLSAPDNCDIPSQLLTEIGTGSNFTCKAGTMSASFDITSSMPTSFAPTSLVTNTADGSRTAAASVSGFPAVSITYDYTGTR